MGGTSCAIILYDMLMSCIGPIIYGLYYFSIVGKARSVADCWIVDEKERCYTAE